MTVTAVPVTHWSGCYADGWQDLIVPEAFAHPAKFARGLIHRIYRHLLEQGHIAEGMTVLDPFGGVALGALDAMTYGLRYVGVELEPRFVALGQQNLDLWRQRYGFTGGTIVQGDSRQLRQVLGGVQAQCVVGSPPFTDSLCSGRLSDALKADMASRGIKSPSASGEYASYGHSPGQLGAMSPGQVGCVVGSPPFSVPGCQPPYTPMSTPVRSKWGALPDASEPYGTTPGQLGAMPPGALVSSPPYAGAGEVLGTHNGIDWSKAQEGGKVATPARQASGEGYGTSVGQLGAMPPGVVVSSPPYEGSNQDYTNGWKFIDLSKRKAGPHTGTKQEAYGHSPGQLGAMPPGAVVSSPPYEGSSIADARHLHFDETRCEASIATKQAAGVPEGYGTSPAQLGNTAGDTFWSASAQIMSELSALLPPGAVCAWVVKAYVSKKAIVPFPDQWRALCEAHGFVLVEEIHASLVEDHGTQEGLFGDSTQVTTEKKSFFRRLAEKKGSPRIDHETVLIVRKAGSGAGVCCVSSPPYAGGCEQLGQIDWNKTHHGSREKAYGSGTAAGVEACSGYGTTPGNLGNLPVGRQ